MLPDIKKYLPYFEGYNLTEAQKVDLIHNVWAIMECFADRAFGLNPVQQAGASGVAGHSNARPDHVHSQGNSTITDFSQAAGPSGRQEGSDHEGE